MVGTSSTWSCPVGWAGGRVTCRGVGVRGRECEPYEQCVPSTGVQRLGVPRERRRHLLLQRHHAYLESTTLVEAFQEVQPAELQVLQTPVTPVPSPSLPAGVTRRKGLQRLWRGLRFGRWERRLDGETRTLGVLRRGTRRLDVPLDGRPMGKIHGQGTRVLRPGW